MLTVLLIGCAEPGDAVLTKGTGAEVADAWAYADSLAGLGGTFFGTVKGSLYTLHADDEVTYHSARYHHWSAFVLRWRSDPDAGVSITRARLVYTDWLDTHHDRPAPLLRAQARVGDVYESDVMRSTLVDHGPCTTLLDLNGWMTDSGEPLDASLLEGVDCLHLSLEKTGEAHPALGEWWLTREYGVVQFQVASEEFQYHNQDGFWQRSTF